MKTIFKIIFFLTFVSASENASAINEWPVPTSAKLVIVDGQYKVVFGEPTYIDGGAYGWEAPAITRLGTWGAYGPPIGGGQVRFGGWVQAQVVKQIQTVRMQLDLHNLHGRALIIKDQLVSLGPIL